MKRIVIFLLLPLIALAQAPYKRNVFSTNDIPMSAGNRSAALNAIGAQTGSTALSNLTANPNLYQGTNNANLTPLANSTPVPYRVWGTDGAGAWGLQISADPATLQPTNSTLTVLGTIGAGTAGDEMFRDYYGWTNRSSFVRPESFGLHPDGTTDMLPTLLTMIYSGHTNIVLSKGCWRVTGGSSAIPLSGVYVTLVGEPGASIMGKSSDADDQSALKLFSVPSGATNFSLTIRNIAITNTSYLLWANGTVPTGPLGDLVFENLTCHRVQGLFHSGGGIYNQSPYDSANTNRVRRLIVRNCVLYSPPGVVTSGGNGGIISFYWAYGQVIIENNVVDGINYGFVVGLQESFEARPFYAAQAVVKNCLFQNMYADVGGYVAGDPRQGTPNANAGPVYIDAQDALVYGCTFRTNYSFKTGGSPWYPPCVYVHGHAPKVINCTFDHLYQVAGVTMKNINDYGDPDEPLVEGCRFAYMESPIVGYESAGGGRCVVRNNLFEYGLLHACWVGDGPSCAYLFEGNTVKHWGYSGGQSSLFYDSSAWTTNDVLMRNNWFQDTTNFTALRGALTTTNAWNSVKLSGNTLIDVKGVNASAWNGLFDPQIGTRGTNGTMIVENNFARDSSLVYFHDGTAWTNVIIRGNYASKGAGWMTEQQALRFETAAPSVASGSLNVYDNYFPDTYITCVGGLSVPTLKMWGNYAPLQTGTATYPLGVTITGTPNIGAGSATLVVGGDLYGAGLLSPNAYVNAITVTNNGSVGPSPDGFTALAVNGGTQTGGSTPAVTVAQTWNSVGTTYTGKLNTFTDSASAAGTLMEDWQVGGFSKMKVDKSGNLTAYGSATVIGSPIGLALNINTNQLVVTNGNVGIGRAAPLAPLHIGSGGLETTADPTVMVSRSIDDTGSGNPHSFVDVSRIDRSGGSVAVASFDASATFTGTNSYDHYAAHKSRLWYQSTGSLNTYYGCYVDLAGSAGAIKNVYRYYTTDGSGVGTIITNNYGIYIDSLTRGQNNYAVYVAGTTLSYFGGSVGIGKTPSYPLDVYKTVNDAATVRFQNPNSGTSAFADIRVENSEANGYTRIMAMGTNYTTSGAYVQNAGVIEAGLDLAGGLSIAARHASGPIRFYTAGTAAGNERAIIDTAGNVGIGTTTPTSMLHIAGPVATSVAVGGTATVGATNSTYLLCVDANIATLPDASTCRGRIVRIKVIAPATTGTVITPSITQLIGDVGVTNYALSASNKFASFQADGTNWWIISNN